MRFGQFLSTAKKQTSFVRGQDKKVADWPGPLTSLVEPNPVARNARFNRQRLPNEIGVPQALPATGKARPKVAPHLRMIT